MSHLAFANHLSDGQKDLRAVRIALVGSQPMADLLELSLIVWPGHGQALHQVARQHHIAGVGPLALLQDRAEGSHGNADQLTMVLLHLKPQQVK